MSDDAGGKSALSDLLGMAPERDGQPRTMTIIDAAEERETGHWYSPAAVREMLAAERERCAKLCYAAAEDSPDDIEYRDACFDLGAAISKHPNVELSGLPARSDDD